MSPRVCPEPGQGNTALPQKLAGREVGRALERISWRELDLMSYLRATGSKGYRRDERFRGRPPSTRPTARLASSSRPGRPKGGAEPQPRGRWRRARPTGSQSPTLSGGRERPSGTSARARKFQAATVTAASTFFPRSTRLLPLLNFSRELTRHFRAPSARS